MDKNHKQSVVNEIDDNDNEKLLGESVFDKDHDEIMDNVKIHYRDGMLEDCSRLAELDDIASGGAVTFLFRDLVPGLTPVEVIAQHLADTTDPYSYKNAIVAQHQERIIGFALSFPAVHHRISKEMRHYFPPDRLAHFNDFFSSRVEDSLYLDALCVDQDFRNEGIGRKLIEMTMDKAKHQGFGALSLIAFADNAGAIGLYEKTGFRIVKKIELKEHELLPHKGGCLLMNCDFARP